MQSYWFSAIALVYELQGTVINKVEISEDEFQNGVVTRSDGSKVFNNQNVTYQYTYSESKVNNNREEFGVIGKSKVLTQFGYGDVGYFGKNTPFKPFLTMGHVGQLHSDYAHYPQNNNIPNYSNLDNFLESNKASLKSILGNYDLIGLLKRIKSLK